MATLDVPGTYPTLAAALVVAVPTDTIVVAAGYRGNQLVSVGVDNISFDIRARVTGDHDVASTYADIVARLIAKHLK